jgi:cation diffusion facilitator family transporter
VTNPPDVADPVGRGVRAARLGLASNLVLVIIKISVGVVGHAYALVADGVESSADVMSSGIVWAGLRIADRPADQNHPFGHGKAEAIAGAVVSLLLLLAAVWITVAAIHGIATPHRLPAPYTLVVAAIVIVVKETLYRRVRRVAAQVGSTAVWADAWHHRSDAVSSAAAFIGIAVALLGQRYIGGPGWEAADDWAALVAACIVTLSAFRTLQPAVAQLMDAAPEPALLARVEHAASTVPGVELIEKLKVRRSGFGYYVELHAQADPEMSLFDAHELSGRVKGAIKAAAPQVRAVLVHMEPFRPVGAVRP